MQRPSARHQSAVQWSPGEGSAVSPTCGLPLCSGPGRGTLTGHLTVWLPLLLDVSIARSPMDPSRVHFSFPFQMFSLPIPPASSGASWTSLLAVLFTSPPPNLHLSRSSCLHSCQSCPFTSAVSSLKHHLQADHYCHIFILSPRHSSEAQSSLLCCYLVGVTILPLSVSLKLNSSP